MEESHKKHTYEIADSFMLRVPLMPLDVIKEISICKSIEPLLKKYYGHPIISESLYLASPALHRLTEIWLDGGNDVILKEKLSDSLLKYLIRMSTRSTPFGLFAGMCTGSFGENTSISLFSADKNDLFLRPDMQYLCSATQKLIKDPELRKKIKYYPNTSLVLAGNEYRYIEYNTGSKHVRKFQLQATAHRPELAAIINFAEKGASRALLAKLLCSDDIAESEAYAYVDALIDNQVLVSELEPTVSGSGYFDEIRKIFREHKVENKITLSIEKIHATINDLEKNAAGKRIEAFRTIRSIVEKTEIPFDERALIQGDMKIGFHSCLLDSSIKQELKEAISVLMKLSRPLEHTLLEKFKDNFLRRYESSEIPLLIALDAEAGPGYLPDDQSANASSLLQGIILPSKKSKAREITWNQIDSFLYRKLQDSQLAGEFQIEIKKGDLDNFDEESEPFPLSFSVLARIGGKWEKNANKDMIHLVSAGGNSAAALAGRFCSIDEKLHQSINNINTLEQDLSKDAILAEIVHLPQQRTGNVLMRPILRQYEIPYLAKSVLADEYVIPISDLMLSVRRNKFMLRSKRLNKFIIPRMSNAHNYSMGSLAVYRFLCDMQSQGIRTGSTFFWGPLENETLFLPRVCYKNFVLQPATWNFTASDMNAIKSAADDIQLKQAMLEIREKFHIPKEIVLAESDNELWLDLENIHCLKVFRNVLRKPSILRLQECFSKYDDAFIKADDGARANEFIFFFHRDINEADE